MEAQCFTDTNLFFLFSDTLILGNIISEESNQEPVIDEEEEENIVVEENIVGADKFVLEVLRTCHHIKNLSLHMHEISDRTGKNHKTKTSECIGLDNNNKKLSVKILIFSYLYVRLNICFGCSRDSFFLVPSTYQCFG